MRRLASSALTLVAAFVVSTAAFSANPFQSRPSRYVVLISLDGFPASALANPRTPVPTLRRLAREGAVATALQPVNPVVTWPNHTTLVTGTSPARQMGTRASRNSSSPAWPWPSSTP